MYTIMLVMILASTYNAWLSRPTVVSRVAKKTPHIAPTESLLHVKREC